MVRPGFFEKTPSQIEDSEDQKVEWRARIIIINKAICAVVENFRISNNPRAIQSLITNNVTLIIDIRADIKDLLADRASLAVGKLQKVLENEKNGNACGQVSKPRERKGIK